jgi:hypothetical protein
LEEEQEIARSYAVKVSQHRVSALTPLHAEGQLPSLVLDLVGIRNSREAEVSVKGVRESIDCEEVRAWRWFTMGLQIIPHISAKLPRLRLFESGRTTPHSLHSFIQFLSKKYIYVLIENCM